jgi:integrase
MARVDLRVAHQRTCANADRTSLDSVDGCTCQRGKRAYYTLHRDGRGRPVKGPRLRDRKAADMAVTKLQAELDQGRVVKRAERIAFAEWADSWLARHKRASSTTMLLYGDTIAVAKQAFGDVDIADLEADDVEHFLKLLAQRSKDRNGRTLSETTLNKHYRNLSACLGVAVNEGKLDRNPAKKLSPSMRPKATTDSSWDYFTDDELRRLWPAMKARCEARDHLAPLYLAKAAAVSGMRLGELLALQRRDVDLTNGRISVERSYKGAGIGVEKPKGGKPRTVYLSPDAVRVFTDWFKIQGVHGLEALVFPNEAGGHINPSKVAGGWLYPAMRKAKPPAGVRLRKGEWGIARLGENGNPRTFHSFRDTYSRIVLEGGASLYWLSGQLGHSSTRVTEQRYAGWSDKARREQAASIRAGAFAI